MSLQFILNDLAEVQGTSASAARKQLRTLEAVVHHQIQLHGKVTLPGIGTISVTQQPSEPGRNPITGKKQQVPGRKVISFVADKKLKAAL